MGQNIRCNRRHCNHQLVDHRRARDDKTGQLLVGVCLTPGCECAQYVHEGLTTGNQLLEVHGDHGLAATPALRYVDYSERGIRDPFDPRLDRFAAGGPSR